MWNLGPRTDANSELDWKENVKDDELEKALAVCN